MKINFIITGLFRSGGMRVIFEYANRLSCRGHDVECLMPLKPYNFNRSSNFEKLRKYFYAIRNYLKREYLLSGLYNYCFNFKMIPYVNNYFIRNADVTIATQWPTAYSVNKLSRKKGKKIYLIQGYEVWDSDKERAEKSYKLPLNRIAVSGFLRKLLLDNFNSSSEVILNGIDYSFFNNDKKQFNLVKNITFIDHYLELKNINVLIEIIKKLRSKYNNIKFTGFGYHKYHNIPDFVTFIENPSDEQIRCIFQNSDIFLFTSLVEGFGLPPAEAMACKCAVVTSKVGAVPEYSVHRKTAIHVNPDNPNEFFEGVCYLLDNESELERISTEGYDMVRSILSWDKSVEKFEKYMLEI